MHSGHVKNRYVTVSLVRLNRFFYEKRDGSRQGDTLDYILLNSLPAIQQVAGARNCRLRTEYCELNRCQSGGKTSYHRKSDKVVYPHSLSCMKQSAVNGYSPVIPWNIC